MMNHLSDRLGTLSPSKLALLSQQLAKRGLDLSVLPRIPRISDRSAIPLSFSQQRLWLIDQLHPGGSAYNLPTALRIHGPFDPDAFDRAFHLVVERHEVLRTSFAAPHGQPVQVIHPACRQPIPRVDLCSLPANERLGELSALATSIARRPFDLENGPLVRSVLVQLGYQDHAVLFCMHHIVSDAWSMEVLIGELGAAYRAFDAGERPDLPELPVQYADYSLWQRRWLSDEVLEGKLAYWRERLAGAPQALELPTDRPRGHGDRSRGAYRDVSLSQPLSHALSRFCRGRSMTPFMILLATFKLLLSLYTRRRDIVVGSPVANRGREEIEGLIGFFVNTLVLRTDLTGDPRAQQLLERVRDTALGAFEHQDLPFEKLVDELSPERSLSRTPLFQVAFTLQNVPDREEEGFADLRISTLATGETAAPFELTLSIEERAGRFRGSFLYNRDLFDSSTVNRLSDQLRLLLAGLLTHPERRISQLDWLSPAEAHQLVSAWNDTHTDYERESSIPDLFELQASRYPHATALVGGGVQMSYGELDRRADRLALRLRRLGVRSDHMVGLSMERSPEMVVAILAILKAGGAYVPLDPSYPAERLAWILEDMRGGLVLGRGSALAALAGVVPDSMRVVEIDGGGRSRDPRPPARVRRRCGPIDLAYVMYTSGSTGRPKGVCVAHQSVLRLVRKSGFASLTREESFLQLAPVPFDASTLEIWAPLLNGGRLVMMPAGVWSLERLASTLERERITSLWLTAGLFHQMVDTHLASLRGLRQLLAGGDVLSVHHVRRVHQELPACRLINGYGPTENTTFTCCYTTTEGFGTSIPIGRPVADTRVYVLDGAMRPVPVGVPGELYTGGDGVARCYLGRPALTAQRFVPAPFGGSPGERVYRTGDLVRYLADGRIEFLGRLDQQVKLRGFRIEPGEIEAVLCEHPAVDEAVVVVRAYGGDKRLAAYLVAAPEESPGAAQLRSFLLEKLPDYMVPASFVVLPELPLNPNGKVDRRALPEPEDARPDLEASFVAPRTPTEELLAGIWADVLKLDRVGVDDDFFALGGHSLLATQVVSRIREESPAALGLRDLFENATVERLARKLDMEAQPRGSESPIEPRPRDSDLPLSFAQQRLWFLDQLDPGSPVYNIPVPVRLRGALDVAVMAAALQEIVRRHESLRTSFAELAGEPVQVVAEHLDLALPCVDLSGLSRATRWHEARRWMTEEALRPFDLTRCPLFRFLVLRLGEDDHVVLVNLHHIISDGWSMGVLLGELTRLYNASAAGDPSPLPELAVQYPDFASWQRDRFRGEVLEAELGYWREKLDAAPAVLELPCDRPRSPERTMRGREESFVIAGELAQRLRDLGRDGNATLFMTLLAAFQALLYRVTGQADVNVGTPIAGRDHRELEGLIGFFVNTLVVRTRFPRRTSFRDLLSQVRETTLEAQEHQAVPFERLVEELRPERGLDHSPLFQVMFALQNALGEPPEMTGLEIAALRTAVRTAKFDLELSMGENSDRLDGALEYATDLFDRTTVQRLAGRFTRLLEAVTADPGAPLETLALHGAVERHQLLTEWNELDVPLDRGVPARGVYELFEIRAREAPNAVAIRSGEGLVSYGELRRRSRGLARRLVLSGVGPETAVGICVDRSPEMLVAVLGVLAAGGVFVPLDPALPRERLRYVLEDCAAGVVLTTRARADRLPDDLGHRTMLLDGETSAEDTAGTDTLPAAAADTNLAYVIYTSGSTGRPKGVAIPRGALANYTLAVARKTGLAAGDRVLQFASLAFDASLEEIFACLTHGATLVLRTEAMLGSVQEFLATCRRWEITLLDLPTAFWHTLTAAGETLELPGGLRHLIIGGEAANPEHLARWREQVSDRVRLWNTYGPTEATIVATRARLARPGVPGTPIGRGVEGARIVLADASLESVPAGVKGEILIGGAGLARGYVGRPALSAERFVPDPMSGEPGARLYRTGDLARWLPEGDLEFLERIDHQVKIRGFRIELGEVEAALAAHEAVDQAVVLARDDPSGGKRLVAYVAARDEVTGEDLRRHLKARLPAYMVPAELVAVDAMPLTSNDKVDRKKLAGLEGSRLESAAPESAPRTPAEELLAGVWSDVLGRGSVGIDDNFFDIGGHSLLATRVIARVRELFGVDLPLRDVLEHPTIAGLAERLSRARGAMARPPVRPVDRDRDLPLSFAQQRLWFLDRLEPGSAAYHLPTAIRIRGALDASALGRCFTEIVRRHEVLRTSFGETDGEPVQIVEPAPGEVMAVIDLRSLPPDRRRREASRRIDAESQRPFDLTRGPLSRFRLFRLAGEDHVALVVLHHIASDGWSSEIMTGEVTRLYAAFREGRPSPLPELPVQYGDYAAWQRRWLRGEVLERQLAFWRRRLGGGSAFLELPTDRPRPAVQTFRGQARGFALGEELAGALKSLSRRQQSTLFMTLVAGFQTLLMRYSGQDDVSLGTPVAGRSQLETEGLIGFFVNTLVLRSDLSGDPGFHQLLARVREVVLESHAHQDVPFERLVEDLQPQRSLSHTPLFQVMLAFEARPRPAPELPGLELQAMETRRRAAMFDLTLALAEGEREIQGNLEYNTDLFDPSTVGRMLGHLDRMLAAAAADPRQRLSELPLMSAAESRQLLGEWNALRLTDREAGTVHGLIEAQAERTPEAVALVAGGERLSYLELQRRVRDLAGRLRRLGVGPEVRVGVCLERSPELVITLLAVFEAGGAYVPLDPAYPADRLAFTLADSAAALLVSRTGFMDELRDALPRLDLDAPERRPTPAPMTRRTAAGPRNLAYVIYTSGSTGRPKGVAIEHGSAWTLLRWASKTFPADLCSGMLAATSVCFDLSVFELFLPLSTGGTVILVRDALELARLEGAEEVRTINTVPSAMAELVRLEGVPPSVRTVNLAGEPLQRRLADSIYERTGVGEVYNLYGPSEDTTYSTFCRVDREADTPPTIGRPVAGTRAYLLDRHLRPVPQGVSGEICLGGAGLARGYLGRPARTAASFVPDPFAGEPGARTYRTGDLARYGRGGEMVFGGRVDHQVKLRGFRIELGEIETALCDDPAVREAVVVTREDQAGDPRLVAYVVGRDETAIERAPLLEALRRRVPEYMVPSAVVVLGELPLTPNGKVDRRALPAPQPQGTQESAGEGPRNPIEEMLAGVWARVLGRERVGIHDNFFELGGHSLLATRVTARVRDLMGVDLPVRAVFEAPTIAELAARVGESGDSAAPPLVAIPRDRDLPLSFSQQRLWFLDRLDPGGVAYNVPVAVRLAGRLDVRVLAASLRAVVARHEALRTRFATAGDQPVQVIDPPDDVPMPVVDLGALPAAAREAELERHAVADARRPFDLARGPLVRIGLLRLGEDDHVVLLALHHAISDGWSMEVLIRDVAALYEAFRRGEDASLPPLPVQYPDFAYWQQQYLRGDALEEQVAYWRRQLAGASPVLELPTDRPRPAVQTFRGRTWPVSLSAVSSDGLRKLGTRQGTTLFMTLLASFQALLARLSGQDDVSIGTPIAGRNRVELEGLIGFFVNTLVLRADLSGDPSFEQLLAQVRERALGAYAHQDLPFEALVETLQPERSLAYSPLFQVLFTLRNRAAEPPRLSDLKMSHLSFENRTAQFDLTLSLEERDHGLGGALEFNTDLFDASTTGRITAQWKRLLGAVIEDPGCRTSQLSLMAPAERHQLLAEWNPVPASPPAGTIHGLVEQQARQTPEAVALIAGDEHLTYRQLRGRARGLAQTLRRRGVGPEVRVGICLERSADLVVAILAVLEAGGAYVPLDPTYPADRLAFTLADSQAALLLSRRRWIDRLELSGTPPLCLEELERSAEETSDAPLGEAGARHLAYVIYTSGSTGRPKGVAIEHGSAWTLLHWAGATFPARRLSETLAATSICFDLSIFELFLPLSVGGTVVLAADALELPRLAQGTRITLINTVPSAIAELVRLGAVPSSVRTVNLAGEPLKRSLARELYETTRVEEVYNLYGPSEDTTYSTFCRVGRDAVGEPTIGRAIDGTGTYLLDRRLRPVPMGAVGELCLSGAGLARGYLGRPSRTGERFVPSPIAGTPGDRLYRTGDLARFRRDGELEFLGRVDHQVKVRGFRIELGEIEAALRRHDAVAEAAVLVREDRPGDRYIVAYVVSGIEPGSLRETLRSALRERLPDYMVPSAFVGLESLPLMPNGKVDRRALPAPERLGAASQAGRAPRDRVESELVGIWQDVLPERPIGIDDNFFDLGGHSLLAVRMMARVLRRFGRDLPLATLFSAPTIEALATVLRREGPSPEAGPLVAIQPAGSRPPFFCVHPVGGHVFCYVDLARQLPTDQPFYGLEARGFSDGEAPRKSIEEMARNYLEAIRGVQPQGPYRLGGWSLGGLVAFEMAQQLLAGGEEVALLALIDSTAPDPEGEDEPGEAALLTQFAWDLVGHALESSPVSLEEFRRLGKTGQLDLLLDLAKRHRVLPADADLSRLSQLFEVFRAHTLAGVRYRPRSLDCGICLFRASEAALNPPEDPAASWDWWSAGALEVEEVPGDHYTLLARGSVETLGQRLGRRLEQARTIPSIGAPASPSSELVEMEP